MIFSASRIETVSNLSRGKFCRSTLSRTCIVVVGPNPNPNRSDSGTIQFLSTLQCCQPRGHRRGIQRGPLRMAATKTTP